MYKRGSIVLIPFPFSDLSKEKIRPAVILSSDNKNRDIIVVFITSNTAAVGKSTVSVLPTTQNSLKKPSVVICDKLATLDKKICLGVLGTLEKETLYKVDMKVKKALGL